MEVKKIREYILTNLKKHRKAAGKPLRIGIINTGGTVMALPNREGKLEPVQSKRDSLKIIQYGADYQAYTELGLLELNLIYHNPQDSSQFLDMHREQFLKQLAAAYPRYDAFLMIHGTDTGAETTRFMHLNLPYMDPVKFWQEGQESFNWVKPLLMVSSQEPAATKRKGELIPNPGSDGDINLILALSIIADKRIGETGVITNLNEALRCTASKKGTESHIPPYTHDTGVQKIAERTAFGLVVSDRGYLRRVEHRDEDYIPTVIIGSGNYEKKVLPVTELSHLEMCVAYLDSKREGNAEVAAFIEKKLPKVILYGSKGAGNVQRDANKILLEMEKEGTYILKVPLPGGRIPPEMHYAVPGKDIPGFNIEQSTARYKVQTVLALMDQLKIEQEQQQDFFYKMMRFKFGNEFLPTE